MTRDNEAGGGIKDNSADFDEIQPSPRASRELGRLLAIMARLRDPERGCDWDVKQTFATIAPYTIEEAYEVVDAVERNDMDDLKDELGDLLLQVVFHACMAEEAGLFSFADVAEAISSKLIRRHPHVFAGAPGNSNDNWKAIKQAEREAKAARRGETLDTGLFEDISAGLPPLLRSRKIQGKVAKLGFDWPSIEPVIEKIQEELFELRAEIGTDDPNAKRRQFEEFGDLIFVVVNLSRWLDIDADAALRFANAKFMRRMGEVARGAEESGKQLQDMTLEEMDFYWERAKRRERGEVD